ncbi:hypothetical protein [Paraburkholderia domus]|uniref:hypothetical protein n=1 Tax=Paraburkholderia domus TaxID=2793075 RepID=UPI001912F783|nr:hypothetical protein [Paraburkholderia domus]MBK5064807.1 hypothetical protein [Burkholderia sp. R-70199]CAE6956636.1 hypothetical protein R70199_07004 [Paraburkholderia domus]
MGFAILPMVAFLFYFGLQMMGLQAANSVPGAGPVGQMQNRQVISAQQAEMWGEACYASASAQPGVVSSAVQVTLPTGVNAPSNEGCVTTPIGTGGRNIYGYMQVAPGAVGQVQGDSNENLIWYRVTRQGAAISLVSGEAVPVPNQIPVGDLVDYSTTAN